ncbi:DUF167 domain-containing protein [Parasedimentitalea marina]|uniref:UPF0235 protein EBB79_15760 n=1 Tax=Parasedimentitalea marina TaxID=2483033 RepID=A0A3T0N5E1_9RHOB|nr:DUF167 domain-containing protein [Parasedimentitalea marina]AZV79189.1 DUF167 domain-containing protein [Parasedimentitalea marina]
MGKPKSKDLPDLGHLAQTGTEIAVRVTPKAARNAIQFKNGQLRISVTVVPENGKANDAVQGLLSKAMGVAPSYLQLKRGQAAREKLFVYSGPSRN